MREGLELQSPDPRDRLDAAASRISPFHSPMRSLRIVLEDARPVLRPRGVSGTRLPGVCAAIRDLPGLRSRTRLLLA